MVQVMWGALEVVFFSLECGFYWVRCVLQRNSNIMRAYRVSLPSERQDSTVFSAVWPLAYDSSHVHLAKSPLSSGVAFSGSFRSTFSQVRSGSNFVIAAARSEERRVG